jgi:hypothetical protein
LKTFVLEDIYILFVTWSAYPTLEVFYATFFAALLQWGIPRRKKLTSTRQLPSPLNAWGRSWNESNCFLKTPRLPISPSANKNSPEEPNKYYPHTNLISKTILEMLTASYFMGSFFAEWDNHDTQQAYFLKQTKLILD